MSDTPVPPQYSWICQECGRKVPNRVDLCRCGSERDPDATGAQRATGVEDATGGSVADQPRPTSMLPWVVLGLVTLAAAGTLIALQVIPVKPTPAPPNVVNTPTGPALPVEPP